MRIVTYILQKDVYKRQQNQELIEFADKLEKATLSTIEGGQMTKDLALITSLKNVKVLNSREFILAIREKFEAM